MIGKMISMIIPLVVGLYLMTTMMKTGSETLDASKGMASMMVVKSELNQIKQLIVSDAIMKGSPTFPDDIPAFVKNNGLFEDTGRDPGKDLWGNPYGIFVNKADKFIVIFSRGPDGIDETDDDIEVDYDY
ncbi:MAG: hypothetical protein ABIA04_12750 [Pseudomonadota bacterium]